MTKINKYGLKMHGLKAASGATCAWDYGYTQISYNLSTGDIYANDHAGTPDTSWSSYHDPDVIHVLNASRHYTMQQIADAIRDAVSFHRMVTV